jgi:hypothetical protein
VLAHAVALHRARLAGLDRRRMEVLAEPLSPAQLLSCHVTGDEASGPYMVSRAFWVTLPRRPVDPPLLTMYAFMLTPHARPFDRGQVSRTVHPSM